MANLVLGYSGGLDSTYVLWKKLVENTDTITAIYVDERYITEDKNGNIGQDFFNCHQMKAVEDCVAWLKSNVRDFNYVRVNNYEYQESDNVQIWLFRYAITNYVNKGLADSVIFGIRSDITEALAGSDGRGHHADSSGKPGTSQSVMVEGMKKTWAATATRGSAVKFPLMDYYEDRLDEIEFPIRQISELPTDLFNLTISCSMGDIDSDGNWVNCGSCDKCGYHTYIKEQLALNTANSAIATSLEGSASYTYSKNHWANLWDHKYEKLVEWSAT